MAIVGGAIIPVIYGAVADLRGLAFALVVPAACYLMIAGYGWLTARGLGMPKPAVGGEPAPRI
jgi:FHS family L-fucose permease-like MFS transporter